MDHPCFTLLSLACYAVRSRGWREWSFEKKLTWLFDGWFAYGFPQARVSPVAPEPAHRKVRRFLVLGMRSPNPPGADPPIPTGSRSAMRRWASAGVCRRFTLISGGVPARRADSWLPGSPVPGWLTRPPSQPLVREASGHVRVVVGGFREIRREQKGVWK